MMRMMLLFSFIIAGFVIVRAVLPCRFRWYWKVLLGTVVASAAFKFHLLRFFGGQRFFNPDLPGWILLIAAWFHGVVIGYFVFLLLADLIRAGCWLSYKIRQKTLPDYWQLWNNRINLGILFFCMFLVSLGMWNCIKVPAVKTVELAFADYPENVPPLRVVLLADLHIDFITREPKIRRIVEKVNELQPDLILIAGDFADGSVAELKQD